ncbi:MAG: SDR family NAD(P)-dependent oxidoreductase [Alphaproteobacteria bacterium]|nr:SDR family NAD(P)-dependent oxidoreductase [Alphaproteobacteria bacterium]MBM3732378.1 SDR family NAD(P)-dependent oxidoreductase [Acidimicrobiia bacterium]MBM3951191.1 SDR family NAD(P)-dependent oxidoreductase [Rhodospirillales bacterium]
MDPKGLAAIVTGGASGLGAAAARVLAEAGAKVAVLDLNLAEAKKIARDIGGLALVCDVADEKSAEEAVAAARKIHGPARINVNCAGVWSAARTVGRDGPMALESFARVVRVNLIGTFNVLRLAAADMAGAEPLAGGERGVIVNTSSIAAFEGQVGQAAYAASKGGIASLTLPVARDLAKSGVRVASVAPGLFATPMMYGLPDEVQKALGDSVPFPSRLGEPREFAKLVLHIVENPMLNGVTIRLDGALRLPPK